MVTGLTRSAKQHETFDACSTIEPAEMAAQNAPLYASSIRWEVDLHHARGYGHEKHANRPLSLSRIEWRQDPKRTQPRAIARTGQPERIRERNRAHFPRAPGLATRHTPGPKPYLTTRQTPAPRPKYFFAPGRRLRGPSCGEGQRTRLRLPLRHRARCDQTPLRAPRSLRQDCAPKGAGRLVAAPSRLGSATARSTETTFAFLAPIPRSTALVRAAPSHPVPVGTHIGRRTRPWWVWVGVQSRGPWFGRRRGGRALAAARPVPELALDLRSPFGESDSPRPAWWVIRCWGPPGLVWVLRAEERATGGSMGRLLPGHGHGFGLGRVPAAHGPHEPSDRFPDPPEREGPRRPRRLGAARPDFPGHP